MQTLIENEALEYSEYFIQFNMSLHLKSFLFMSYLTYFAIAIG